MADSILKNDYNQYQENLSKWEQFLGLPRFEPERSEIETILTMTRDDLKQRSSVELAEYGFMLAQYALFLQQKANECQAFLQWANNNIKRLMKDDKVQLNKWTRNVEIRNTRISYLARRIEYMTQSLANLTRARYNAERNNNESASVD